MSSSVPLAVPHLQPIATHSCWGWCAVRRDHLEHVAATKIQHLFARDVFTGADMGIAFLGFANMTYDPVGDGGCRSSAPHRQACWS